MQNRGWKSGLLPINGVSQKHGSHWYFEPAVNFKNNNKKDRSQFTFSRSKWDLRIGLITERHCLFGAFSPQHSSTIVLWSSSSQVRHSKKVSCHRREQAIGGFIVTGSTSTDRNQGLDKVIVKPAYLAGVLILHDKVPDIIYNLSCSSPGVKSW